MAIKSASQRVSRRSPRLERNGRRNSGLDPRRIREDLERRGVAGDFSDSICERLVPFSEDLTPELYDAVLSGVAMAFGVQRRDARKANAPGAGLAEVERLLASFVDELNKLDESLDTLEAYVSRIREQVNPHRDETLH